MPVQTGRAGRDDPQEAPSDLRIGAASERTAGAIPAVKEQGIEEGEKFPGKEAGGSDGAGGREVFRLQEEKKKNGRSDVEKLLHDLGGGGDPRFPKGEKIAPETGGKGHKGEGKCEDPQG